MGIRKYTSQIAYFKNSTLEKDPQGAIFARLRMNKGRFKHLLMNLDCDLNWMSDHLTSQILKIYTPSKFLSSDETMCPSKSRNNPHHYFISGKPHPNGCLSTSCGDENKILVSIKLRRRIISDFDPLLYKKKRNTI